MYNSDFDIFNNFKLDGIFKSYTSSKTKITTDEIIDINIANIYEDDKDFVFILAAPGLKKDTINIEINENIIHITAKIKKLNYKNISKKFRYQNLNKKFKVSGPVNLKNIKIKYKNGLLYIFIKKKNNI